jgi:lipooligosaccharide transport system permease protein
VSGPGVRATRADALIGALPATPAVRQAPRTWRALRFWSHRFAKTWRAQVGMTVFYPIIYLAAIGVGLGSLIDHHLGGATATLGGVPYLSFVAPGLLAASAMQIASSMSMWPVYGAIRWDHTYESQLATPLEVSDVLGGHLAFVAARLALAGSLFLAVIAGFGAVSSPEALLALPASVLTGLACATPLFALAAVLRTETAFAPVQRLVVVPLFLFSGDFFPVSRLPGWLQALAEATPLYHGVSLCRAATLGNLDRLASLGHLAYLAALALAGYLAARRRFQHRLAT